MRRRLPGRAGLIAAVSAVVLAAVAPAAYAAAHSPGGASSWTVYHGSAAGTGTTGPVAKIDIKRPVWTSPALDGQIYGEPLYLAGRVYLATENDSVYALAASTGAVAWRAHLGNPVASSSLPCGDITPTVGITGTPVIDPARQEIFVVADEVVRGKPAHMLVGLSTTSGKTELAQDVDPAGADPAALLQRTGLTLDAGRVVFGMGGNFGDCGSYRGRVIAVPESGGKPFVFTVDAGPGESQGAVWMGGAAPAVDASGDVWVTVGNGSVHSAKHAYDDSDSVLELTPAMRLRQYFAPKSWAADNASDKDLSTEPALLPGGHVVAAGKAGRVYLLDASHLRGIGGARAIMTGVCHSNDIDGGMAVSAMTVFLPCVSGIVAVRAVGSPPGLHQLWNSSTGGGPPVLAGGLVWTIGQNGTLYGLDLATGAVREQATIGRPTNHFPTPSVAGGLLLAPSATRVVAFAAVRAGKSSSGGAAPGHHASQPVTGSGLRSDAALIVVGALLLAAVIAGVLAVREFGAARRQARRRRPSRDH